jgi:hypothetical protein
MLAEEQAHGLQPFDGRDLPVKMEELRACVASVEDDHAIEAGKLSMLVLGISHALVDLGMLPIWDIPQLPKIA